MTQKNSNIKDILDIIKESIWPERCVVSPKAKSDHQA
jgi:hypothetical protein